MPLQGHDLTAIERHGSTARMTGMVSGMAMYFLEKTDQQGEVSSGSLSERVPRMYQALPRVYEEQVKSF